MTIFSTLAERFVRKSCNARGSVVLHHSESRALHVLEISIRLTSSCFLCFAPAQVAEGEAISPVQGLVFGGAASAVMSTATYPLLLARTKMQTQGTAVRNLLHLRVITKEYTV